jgi:DNA (cytosine-5)-methyltransferase 1
MNELALFAGAGGGLLASKLLGWNTVCAVEIGEYPREVLLQRQRDGHLEKFPIWDDIKTFNGGAWKGKVDIVTGGFPCQYFSTATHGKQTSQDLWAEMARVVSDVSPRFVFCENVSKGAIIKAGIDLFSRGYSSKYAKISAADLGADHVRARYWLLAHSDMHSEFRGKVNAETQGLQEFCRNVWKANPEEFRVVDGVARRMDRLKAAGNGQVPIVAAKAWSILTSK